MKRQNKYHFFFGGFRNSLYLCNVVWLRLYDFAECLKKRYFTNYNIKVMKKLLLMKTMLLLCALIVGSSSVWATDVTFTPGTDTGDNTVTKNNVTVELTTMSNSSYYQIYANSTGTISCSVGNITKIEFTCTASGTAKYGPGNASTDVGTYAYSENTGTWTGSAASVTISTTAQIRMSSLTVTYVTSDSRTEVNVMGLTVTPSTITVGGSTATAEATLNIAKPASASITYSSLDTDKATCTAEGVVTAVAKGTARIQATLTIPNDDPTYRVGTATATYNVTVSNPSHTAKFSINGVIDDNNDVLVEEGEDITFPADPADIGGKSFRGWTTAAMDATQDDAPAVLVNSAIMGNANITYYAVYATVEGVTSESWTETTIDAISASDVFVFSDGKLAMANDNGTTSAPAATAITVSEGKITSSVADKLKWQVSGNATDGYIFYPSGSTETWLYCNTTASSSSNNNIRVGVGNRKLWKFDANGYLLTNDTYTDRYLSIYNEQDFRGYINTSYGAFVPKFYKYIAASGSYSGYCTEVKLNVTVSAAGLATFANDYALDFTNVENLEAYIAKENGTTIELEKVDKVPANTGVLLRAKNDATDFNVPVTTAAADDVTDNIFVRGTGAVVESGTGPYNYVLGKHDGVVGFYKAGGMVVATNKAYLQTTIAAARIDVNFDETTALTLVNSEKRTVNSDVFDLQGRKVANPTKDLYIVNGKKVNVK